MSKLIKLKNEGSLIKYVGCISLGNMQIQSISVTSAYTNWGGYDVDLSLKEIRVAKSAYDAAKSAQLSKKAAQSAQTKKGDNSKVWHVVKKGECVWSLVISGPYKNLKPSYSRPMDKCDWVRDQNPNAFSRPKDYKTLKIGYRLYVGYR